MPRQFEALIKYGSRLDNPSETPMINAFVEFRAADINWPLELEQKIHQVDDPTWGLKQGLWSIDSASTNVKHTATLIIKIAEGMCNFRPRIANGVPYYAVHPRPRPQWDRLCEKWFFFVHPTGREIITEANEKNCYYVECTLDDALEVQTMEDAMEDVTSS